MVKQSIFASAVLVAALSGAAHAQVAQAPRPPAKAAEPATPAQPGAAQLVGIDDRGARDTRDRLRVVLQQYPPSVRQVLRIDPSLLSRPDYLATYPALAAFLAQHPEVAHNPAFFVGDANGIFMGDPQPQDAKIEALRTSRSIGDDAMAVAIVFIITFALAGVVRTLLEQRRWHRAARMQMDVQTKLIDRFSGTDELLAYVQSPASRALTELQAPGVSAAQGTPFPMGAPLGRIFWSLQAGIVLAAAGIGLMLVGGRVTFDELGQPLSGLGILALAVGAGFVVSAGVSYLISHRLGLVAPATPPDFHREAPGA